jgi:hypothetical protein
VTLVTPLKAFVKKAFWRSPYFCRIAVLYSRHLLIERRRVRARIAETGIPLLSRDRLDGVKRTDTLFVLGSGSSINRIGPARWATIGRYDSIGLNFWLFHQFVPTMYYFELVEGHEHDIIRDFTAIAGRAASRYQGTFKIASEFHNGLRLLEGLSGEFRQNLCAHLSVPAYIDNDRQLRTSIRLLRQFRVFAPHASPHNLFKHAGSLSSVLCLAVKMHYRRIVLCGIDLSSPEYFYQDRAFYPDGVHVQSSIRTPRHESIMPRLYRNAYPADRIVAELKKQVLDPLGIELYVENKSSALYPGVPLASDRLWAALEGARAS